jgi:hypothetical protein
MRLGCSHELSDSGRRQRLSGPSPGSTSTVSTDDMLPLLGDAWAAPRIQCCSPPPLTDSGCGPCPALRWTQPRRVQPGSLKTRRPLMQPLLQAQPTMPHSWLRGARLQPKKQATLWSAHGRHRRCGRNWLNAGPTRRGPSRRWPRAGQGCGRRRSRTGARLWRSSARRMPLSRPPPATTPTVNATAGTLTWHCTGLQCGSGCLVMCAAAGLLRDGGEACVPRSGLRRR